MAVLGGDWFSSFSLDVSRPLVTALTSVSVVRPIFISWWRHSQVGPPGGDGAGGRRHLVQMPRIAQSCYCLDTGVQKQVCRDRCAETGA